MKADLATTFWLGLFLAFAPMAGLLLWLAGVEAEVACLATGGIAFCQLVATFEVTGHGK